MLGEPSRPTIPLPKQWPRQVVELKVGYLSRRMHLPIVELKRAA